MLKKRTFLGKLSRITLAGFAALLLLASTFTNVQTVHAAPDPGEGAGPAPANWLNRGTIVYGKGVFTDTATNDNKFEYRLTSMTDGTQGPYCSASINFDFDHGDRWGISGKFFYTDSSLADSATYTACNGGKKSLSVSDVDKRRVSFIQTNQKTIVHFQKTDVVFSSEGSGDPSVFVRKGQSVKSCADVIILKSAKTAGDVRDGTEDQVRSGSSTLYAVDNRTLGLNAESYDNAVPNTGNLPEDKCGQNFDEYNKTFELGYGDLNAGSGGAADIMRHQFLAYGLKWTGANTFEYAEERDDTYLIYVGTPRENTPPVNGAEPPDNGVCEIPGKKHLSKDDPACKQDTTTRQPVCEDEASGLAHIICPLLRAIDGATQWVFKAVIKPFLEVNPLTENEALFKIWQNILNIANVAFVLAFFAIIFSQATSIGLSNYGIKRLLPKLIAVAIATNLSFYICAFMVDVTNILGEGLGALMFLPVQGLGQGIEYSNLDAALTVGLGGGLIAAGVVSAGGLLPAIVSLVLIGFVAILITVVVLVLRQMFIIMLVILSPFAFVAYLLPNTEQYARKWASMFSKLLLMYPLIVALFASGTILTYIVNTTTDSRFAKAFSFFFIAIPLFALPFTFTVAGGIIGRGMGAVSSRLKGYGEQGRKAIARPLQERAKLRRSELAYKARNVPGVGRLATYGRRRKFMMESRQRELERAQNAALAGSVLAEGSRLPGKAAGVGGPEGAQRVLASAQAVISKAEREELENASALLVNARRKAGVDQKGMARGLAAYLANHQNSVVQGATGSIDLSRHPELMKAALHEAASAGEVGVIESARMSTSPLAGVSTPQFQSMVDEVINYNSGTLMGKGGYHLATKPELAAGRAGLPADPEAAKLTMDYARLTTLANTTASDIGNLKYGAVYTMASMLKDPQKGPQLIARLKQEDAQNNTHMYEQLRTTLDQALTNPNIRGTITDRESFVKDIQRAVEGLPPGPPTP
ncbi:MAG: hypothetical protein ACREGJ_04150 [Candidatus Saccharimonadales bacterium]